VSAVQHSVSLVSVTQSVDRAEAASRKTKIRVIMGKWKHVSALCLASVFLSNSTYSSFADSEADQLSTCQLKKTSTWPLAPGFPRSNTLVESTGTLRHLFIYVDFPDNKSTLASKKFADQYFLESKKFIEAQSYGKLKFVSDVSTKVFRINKNSSVYGLIADGKGDGMQLIQDAITAADPETDFSKYDFVTVFPPITTKTIKTAGAIGGALDAYKATEKNFSTGIAIGQWYMTDLSSPGRGWSMFSHEVGHVLGLTHPYFQKNGGPGAIWDLMGNGGTSVREFIGWHRFLLSWLADKEVVCLSGQKIKPTSIRLSPISSRKVENKFAMIQLDETKAIGIEVRRKNLYDNLNKNEEGTLVYLIDTTKGDDEGIITILGTKKTLKDGQLLGSLKPGEGIAYKGVTVKVLASNKSGDSIEISRS
jgi:M6 family metalloprotease-like protein